MKIIKFPEMNKASLLTVTMAYATALSATFAIAGHADNVMVFFLYYLPGLVIMNFAAHNAGYSSAQRHILHKQEEARQHLNDFFSSHPFSEIVKEFEQEIANSDDSEHKDNNLH